MPRFKFSAPPGVQGYHTKEAGWTSHYLAEWKTSRADDSGSAYAVLQDSAHDSAIRADRRAVCGGSERTGEIDDHVGNFIGA